MTIEIGVNPNYWTLDAMPWLGDATLETSLEEARQAGYSGIEMGARFPDSAKALGPLVDRHGLRLITGWHTTRLTQRTAAEETAAARNHLDMLVALEASVLVAGEVIGGDEVWANPLVEGPRLPDGEWARFGERMTEFAEHVRGRGIAFAYHPHLATVVESDADVDRFVAVTGDAVGLTVDVGNVLAAGGDAVALVRRHAGRIRHVHCKDFVGGAARPVLEARGSLNALSLAGAFPTPGDGDVDWTALCAALRDIGYRGWLVNECEVDPTGLDSLDAARRGHRTIQDAAAAAGL